MNVVVDGLMTNYQKAGKGKTLLFLPGWADDSRTFAQLTDKLKDKYQVVALDLPGFGGSQAPPDTWGLTEYADFVGQFLKKTAVKPYALIGHSYGGAVAITAAGRAPIAGHLILLASAGIRNKSPIRKKILAGGAKIGKLPLMLLPAPKRKSVKAKLYDSIGSDITAAPHMEPIFRRIVRQDVRQTANKISIPTLLIYGSRDNAAPVSDGHLLNRSIRGSRLEVIGAGHFLHQEKAGQVANMIDNFLRPNV